MSRNLLIAIVVVIIIIGGFLLVKNSGQSAPTPSPVASETPTPADTMSASPSASAASSSAQTSNTVTVLGSEFAFAPSNINVKMGTPVTLTFRNEGKFPHNLTITDLNVKTKTIQPGESDTITFTPTKAGSFNFFCSVDSHAQKGMKGTLTVQ